MIPQREPSGLAFDQREWSSRRRVQVLGDTLREWLVGRPLASVECSVEGVWLHAMDGKSLGISAATVDQTPADLFGQAPARVDLRTIQPSGVDLRGGYDCILMDAQGRHLLVICVGDIPLVLEESPGGHTRVLVQDEQGRRAHEQDRQMGSLYRQHAPLSEQAIAQTVEYLRQNQRPWRSDTYVPVPFDSCPRCGDAVAPSQPCERCAGTP